MWISGTITDRAVYVNGRQLNPKASQKVINHSPDGFSWGYGGSGPAQLALALLLRAGLSHDLAIRLHQPFKWEVIAKLDQNRDFELSMDVIAWARIRNDTVRP